MDTITIEVAFEEKDTFDVDFVNIDVIESNLKEIKNEEEF